MYWIVLFVKVNGSSFGKMAPIFASVHSFWLLFLMSFCELLGFHWGCIHISEDVSLLSQHAKHQLSTCISTELFQGLSSHRLSIYVFMSHHRISMCFPIYFVS